MPTEKWSIGVNLVIPHKAARLSESGVLGERAHRRQRSFAALRMTGRSGVILRCAQDLSRTSGESPGVHLLEQLTLPVELGVLDAEIFSLQTTFREDVTSYE